MNEDLDDPLVKLHDQVMRAHADIQHIAKMLASPPIPSHFSRLDPRGHCPMCKGSRKITALSEPLVIGRRNIGPDSENFLTPEANAVLKGVRHNDMIPFLRRLTREGLWDAKISFERLDKSERELILFGFWARPGAGSFLKTPSADRSEVASWLRWDGLYRHVLNQVDRSQDVEWTRRVHESAHLVRCILCGGSGLRRFARLLQVGDISFNEWTLLSDSKKMLRSLQEVRCHTPRQQLAWERVLYCLAPLIELPTAAARAIVERSVSSFTTMPAVELSEADGS